MYVCGSDDWYFSIWHVSMSLEFHWQLSNWVEPLRASKLVLTFISRVRKLENNGYQTLDVLSYSIASGIPVTLTRVKCWNINHQNHKHTYSHEVHDQNDRSNRCNTLYGCDDWYFSIWHVSMSQEFHWQLSNWVGPIKIHVLMNLMINMINLIDIISYMTVMTDISAFDNRQCHRNSTGNWVTE